MLHSLQRHQMRPAPAIVFSIVLSTLSSLAFAALPPVPVPAENPVTEPKRILGKLLFWDEQLSSDNSVACGTCHQLNRAGTDVRRAVHPGVDQQFGTADDAFGSAGVVRRDATGQPINDPVFGGHVQVTPRNSPSVTGSLWAPELFWDGRAGSTFVNPQTGSISIASGGALENQAIQPILAANEMARDNRTWSNVVEHLSVAKPMALASYLPPDMKAAVASNPTYASLFAAAFGTPTITAERIVFAIASYERTLVADRTPFDLGTLTPQQQLGLATFNSATANCAACHVAPLFTDNTFRNIGVRPIAEDPGRQIVTGDIQDAGRFKVPTLRSVGLKRFFMHNGRLTTLEQVIDFYLNINGQVQFPQNRDPAMTGITLSNSQRTNLIEFMRNGLTDPRLASGAFPFDQPILKGERGDVDRDGDVDAADRASFVACFTGAGSGVVDAGCERADMDGDADVDCDDWLLFQAAWTGASPPAALQACAAVAPAPIPAVSQWTLVAMTTMLAFAALSALRRRFGRK